MFYNYEEAAYTMRVLKLTMDDMLTELSNILESKQEKYMTDIQALTRSMSIIGPIADILRIEKEEKDKMFLFDKFEEDYNALNFSDKERVKEMFEKMGL